MHGCLWTNSKSLLECMKIKRNHKAKILFINLEYIRTFVQNYTNNETSV